MADTKQYIDSVNVGGTHYEIADPQARAVATEKYDENVEYAEGNFCIKDDILYKFTKAKTKGPWDAGVVEPTTVPVELQAMQKKITDLTEKLYGDIASLTEKQQVIKETFVQAQTDSNGNLYLGIRSSERWILDAWSVDGCVSVGLTSESEYVLHCSTWTNWNRGVLDITVWYTYVER